MFIIYNVLFTGFCFLAMPYFVLKALKLKKYRNGLLERLGMIAHEKLSRLSAKRIWLHAVSVGEASAAYPLYHAFKTKYPNVSVIFSTTTLTGQQWIQAKLEGGDIAIYFPIDIYWIVRSVLKRLKPMALVVVETEIWPNLWWLAARAGVGVALINARLSPRSFRGYSRIVFFMKKVLELPSFISAQTDEDAQRFIRLGAPAGKVGVSGNLKFESSIPLDELLIKRNQIRQQLHLGTEMALVGGSTHEGEEAILLDIFEQLLPSFPALRLILAPRHPERFEEVKKLIREKGFTAICSSHPTALTRDKVLLVDQIGQLPHYYALATLVFIGKSLTAHGGQNLLEPAAMGKVVVFGPYMENFQNSAALFLSERAAVQVKDEEMLKEVIQRYLNSEVLRDEMASRARILVQKNKGALAFNLKQIEKHLLW